MVKINYILKVVWIFVINVVFFGIPFNAILVRETDNILEVNVSANKIQLK